MDTSILHNKILDYQSKAKHPMQKEMIGYFKNWLYSLENYLSDVEWENIELSQKIIKQNELIEYLVKLLIITGNSDKLVIDLGSDNIKNAIDLLTKSNDRNNHNQIIPISILQSNAVNEGIKIDSIKQLKEYASRGRKI